MTFFMLLSKNAEHSKLHSAYDFIETISWRAFMYKWIFLCPYDPTKAIMGKIAWDWYVSVGVVSVYGTLHITIYCILHILSQYLSVTSLWLMFLVCTIPTLNKLLLTYLHTYLLTMNKLTKQITLNILLNCWSKLDFRGDVMTWNTFRITGHLWGEPPIGGEFLSLRARVAEWGYFLCCYPEKSYWKIYPEQTFKLIVHLQLI